MFFLLFQKKKIYEIVFALSLDQIDPTNLIIFVQKFKKKNIQILFEYNINTEFFFQS